MPLNIYRYFHDYYVVVWFLLYHKTHEVFINSLQNCFTFFLLYIFRSSIYLLSDLIFSVSHLMFPLVGGHIIIRSVLSLSSNLTIFDNLGMDRTKIF